MKEHEMDEQSISISGMTREDGQRLTALQMAIDLRNGAESPSDFVARAEVFLTFLRGSP